MSNDNMVWVLWHCAQTGAITLTIAKGLGPKPM